MPKAQAPFPGPQKGMHEHKWTDVFNKEPAGTPKTQFYQVADTSTTGTVRTMSQGCLEYSMSMALSLISPHLSPGINWHPELQSLAKVASPARKDRALTLWNPHFDLPSSENSRARGTWRVQDGG